MMRRTIDGFTLVEVLIVVIILAILATIVIPQFSTASSDSRVSNIKTNLQCIRGQIQTYKAEHADTYPTSEFMNQMILYSTVSGTTATVKDETCHFGPYLSGMPINPISNLKNLRIVSGESTAFAAPATDGGWWYNTTTGEFRADLMDKWITPDGTRYNTF
jgi:general secretion pathway protein G